MFKNDFSKLVWEQNYKAPTDEKIQDTWKRIAKGVIVVEKKELQPELEEKIYNLLYDWKFSPGGRINANIGIDNRSNTTLMNCFVHHPADINLQDPDSIENIYNLLKYQAHTLKSEGGYGTNFSFLRPRGCYVEGIGGRTPGVVKIMELWDKSSEIITMGGPDISDNKNKYEKIKIRKGAQMGVLGVWHPEIFDFINAKKTPNVLTKFNLSIGITERFMDCVIEDKDWDLIFPITNSEHYKSEWKGNIQEWVDKGYPVKIYDTVKARKLWETIMISTYNFNEPGVLFLDLANKLNPLRYCETIEASNPCGEILMSTGVCNLGSLNVVKYIKKIEQDKYDFDFERYIEDIHLIVRFLDNINDISNVPLIEYKESMLKNRRIGFGLMGLGSLGYMLGLKYGSSEFIKFSERLYKIKCEQELLASAKLGELKGNFPNFDKEKYFSTYWWNNLSIDKNIKKEIERIGCMRNSQHSANAPTGNTGIYCGIVSGGIEPVYDKEFIRWVTVVINEQERLKKLGFEFPNTYKGEWFETKHMKFSKRGEDIILKGEFENKKYTIDKNRGLCIETKCIDYGYLWAKENYTSTKFKQLEDDGVFVCTEDLEVEDHLNVLKTISPYVNFNSSKTINVSRNYPYEDFKNIYLEAWKSNIKGLTSYRTGTMAAVLETDKAKTELEELFKQSNGNVIEDNVKLPVEYYAKGYNIKDINNKKWYMNVVFADHDYKIPFGIFINTNSYESTEIADNVITSMENLLMSKNINQELIDKQRDKYKGQSNVNKVARAISMALRHNIDIQEIINILNNHNNGISTLLFHIKKILSLYIKNGTKVKINNNIQLCPVCEQDSLIYQEGCVMCNNCAWSKCG